MPILSLERHIDAAVLDGRGSVEVSSGAVRLLGVLREVPHLFVEGAQLQVTLQVGNERFDAVCRVLDDAVACAPGSRVALEVLRAAPAGISGIEPFDLVPLTPNDLPAPKGGHYVLTPPFGSLPPQTAFADAPIEDDEPTGVIGTLREMPVSEIVQTLASGRRDAIVEIKPKSDTAGSLAIEKGRVVFAQKGRLVGEDAFYALFMATRGAFRIRYGRHVDHPNINRETTYLLLEAARHLDELNSGRRERPLDVPAPPPLASSVPPVTVPPKTLPPTTLSPRAAMPPASADGGWRVPSSSSGLFSRFFDEAGVHTPPPIPMPTESARFQSLRVPGVADVDDPDALDSQPTARERRPTSFSSNSNP
ncbi:MAG: DUF4388 domain-containing protein [Deltaproteobacteria bacterium]|nr:DUF4388 domain-containing protein [Deltaproteobacteria bacterium]